jgi:hypothetical protein
LLTRGASSSGNGSIDLASRCRGRRRCSAKLFEIILGGKKAFVYTSIDSLFVEHYAPYGNKFQVGTNSLQVVDVRWPDILLWVLCLERNEFFKLHPRNKLQSCVVRESHDGNGDGTSGEMESSDSEEWKER